MLHLHRTFPLEEVNPDKKIKYTYYKEFDNIKLTLDDAYEYYDKCDLVHLYDNNTIKCYQEFINMEDIYEMGDLILTDNI